MFNTVYKIVRESWIIFVFKFGDDDGPNLLRLFLSCRFQDKLISFCIVSNLKITNYLFILLLKLFFIILGWSSWKERWPSLEISGSILRFKTFSF